MTYTGQSTSVGNGLTQKTYSYSPLNSLVNIVFSTWSFDNSKVNYVTPANPFPRHGRSSCPSNSTEGHQRGQLGGQQCNSGCQLDEYLASESHRNCRLQLCPDTFHSSSTSEMVSRPLRSLSASDKGCSVSIRV